MQHDPDAICLVQADLDEVVAGAQRARGGAARVGRGRASLGCLATIASSP